MATVSCLSGMSRRVFTSPAVFARLASSGSSGKKTNEQEAAKDMANEKSETKATQPQKAKQDSVTFDNTKYQAEQYFSYNEMSYYDIECEMSSDRLVQPSKFSS